MIDLMPLAKRLDAQIHSKVPDTADDVMTVPGDIYNDADRFERERTALFRRYPVFAGWSSELDGPNAFRTIEIDGVGIILTRDKAGQLHAFRNACRHRGMPITTESSGCASRFVCPFHGWTFGSDGSLIGVNQGGYFPGVTKETHGLLPIATAEKHGMIFVQVEGAETIDIDAHLSGLSEDLAQMGWDKWQVARRTEHTIDVNWKLLADGFCEGYHFTFLHSNTLGAMVIPYVHVVDHYGRHTRELFANQGMATYFANGTPEKPPVLGPDIALVYLICPNLIIMGVDETFWYAVALWPGDNVGQTRVEYSVLLAPSVSEDQHHHCLEHARFFWEQVIQAEDFTNAMTMWRTLKGGRLFPLHFGKNEAPLQHWHKQYMEMADAVS